MIYDLEYAFTLEPGASGETLSHRSSAGLGALNSGRRGLYDAYAESVRAVSVQPAFIPFWTPRLSDEPSSPLTRYHE